MSRALNSCAKAKDCFFSSFLAPASVGQNLERSERAARRSSPDDLGPFSSLETLPSDIVAEGEFIDRRVGFGAET